MQQITVSAITSTLFSHGFTAHVSQLGFADMGQAESLFVVRTEQVWDTNMGYTVHQGCVSGLLMPWFEVTMVRPLEAKAANDAVYAQQVLAQDLHTEVARHGATLRVFQPTTYEQPY